MISRDPEAAVYRKIARDIRGKIASGELAPGQPVGSLPTLMHQYGVGIGTIRRVITVLRTEGLIVVAHGQVTRVAEPGPVQSVKLKRGSVTGPSRPATPDEIRDMNLPEGAWVTPVRDPAGHVTWYSAAGYEFPNS